MGYNETYKMWKILEKLFTESHELRNLTTLLSRCFPSPDLTDLEEEEDSIEEEEGGSSQEFGDAKDLESSLLSEHSVRKKKEVVVQRLEGVKFVIDFLEYYSQLVREPPFLLDDYKNTHFKSDYRETHKCAPRSP
jgi:hypothetical protein